MHIDNVQDGDQPIHIAAGRGYPDIVKALIQEFHVDPMSKAKVRDCPLFMRREEIDVCVNTE